MGRVRGWKTQLAERLGISPAHLSRVMAGKRRVGGDVLKRAAREFRFDRLYFFTPIDEPEPSYHHFPRPTPEQAKALRERPVQQVAAMRQAARQILASTGREEVPRDLILRLARALTQHQAVDSARLILEHEDELGDFGLFVEAASMAVGILTLLGDPAIKHGPPESEIDSETS